MKLNTIAFTALAAAGIASATVAAADSSYFSFQRNLDAQSTLELGTVLSEGNGVIEIYSYNRGEIGALLGTESVHNGANANVRVNVGIEPRADVLAVLTVNGQTVATREYLID